MAKRKRKSAKPVEQRSTTTLSKLVRVLAMWMIKGSDTEEAAVKLSAAGFDPTEISEMLLVNKNYVHTAKNRWKKKIKARARSDET